MKNKILIIILFLLGGLALLIVGGYAGILIEAQKAASQPEIGSKLTELAKSKVVPSIMAVGEVTNISDRTITLTSQEESLAIPIAEDAKITSFVFSAEEPSFAPQQKTINFEDIKLGNKASISLKILPDGGFEGVSIGVF